MIHIDGARSRAILLGASRFEREPDLLPPLPAVATNLAEVARCLRDTGIIGLPPDHITVLVDRPGRDMLAVLSRVAEEPGDTLIVYYAGHGVVDGRRLFLTGTDCSIRDIRAFGVAFDEVKEVIQTSPAAKRVLILDCCYSGRAADHMGASTTALQARIDDVEGTYVITASGATEPAKAPLGQRLTAFTTELVDILDRGLPTAGATITLPELFREIRTRMRRVPGLSEPQQSARQNMNDMAFARNRAYHAPKVRAEERPAWVSDLLDEFRGQSRRIEELEAQLRAKDRHAAHNLIPSGLTTRTPAEINTTNAQSLDGASANPDRLQNALQVGNRRIKDLENAIRLKNTTVVVKHRHWIWSIANLLSVAIIALALNGGLLVATWYLPYNESKFWIVVLVMVFFIAFVYLVYKNFRHYFGLESEINRTLYFTLSMPLPVFAIVYIVLRLAGVLEY